MIQSRVSKIVSQQQRREHLAAAATTAAQAGPLDMFLAGGLAGLVSWQAIIYLDVIKSRIQADDIKQPKYSGMVDCVIKSYRESGIRVFGRGFILMSLRAFPLNGATFLGYEYCMKICQS